jgi:outer membrane protein, heavy metal efflux system
VTAVPDVTVQAGLIQDASPPGPNRLVTTVQVGMPVPVWDRNQGGVRQARGNLLRAVEEPHRVRSELTAKVAEAYRRYSENRAVLSLYRTQILPKQVQAYRAAVKRHYAEAGAKVSFIDLINSEQVLVASVNQYFVALAAQWQAVADVAALLQTDDLYGAAAELEACPTPGLEQLLALPCCHPCGAGACGGPAPEPAGAAVSFGPVQAIDRAEPRSGRTEEGQP